MSEVFAHMHHNTSAELMAIESKKSALIALIKITKTVNRLLTGIEAVSSLSESTFQLPPRMKKFYRGIYGKFKHDPTGIINSNLSEIELRIRNDMSSIIRLTELNEHEFMMFIENSVEKTANGKMRSILQVFRRRAQTAVSLRLILKERGLAHAPIVLDIPEEKIRTSIKALEIKEKRCTEYVKTNIEDFVKTIDVLFIDGQADDGVLDYLGSIRAGLIKNLEHLNAGKCISEIPFPFEQIELENDSDQKSEKTLRDKPKPVVQSEITEDATSKRTIPKPTQLKHRRGFFKRFWSWLNSPMKKRWQDDDSRYR